MDAEDEICVSIARKARERARRQSPPLVDYWDDRCAKLAKLGSNLPQPYHPSDQHVISFSSAGYGGFEHESQSDTEWRDASNRMKRAGDLRHKRAVSRADLWGLWCSGRGASPDRTARNNQKDV